MIFTSQAGTLANAISLAAMGVRGSAKIVKPSDGVARITATANMVDVGCSDRCVTIRASAAASVISPGSVAVAADRFFKLTAGFAPDATITMTDGVITRGDTGRYKLPTIGDLPELAAIDAETAIMLSGDQVLTLLEPVVAADGEATRKYLNSVFLQTASDELVATSTNGTRLIRTAVRAAPFAPGRDLIVPEPSALVLRKLIRQTKPAKVILKRSKAMFAAATPEFTFTTKLIDFEYPDLGKVIPAPTENTAVLAHAELKGVLARLTATATVDGISPISLIVLAWSHGDPLEIFLVRQPDAGTDLIDASTKGAARIVVPLRGFAALLEEIKGENIEITATNPVRIRATDDVRKFALLCQCAWNFSDSS